jgi:hypothetical protein
MSAVASLGGAETYQDNPNTDDGGGEPTGRTYRLFEKCSGHDHHQHIAETHRRIRQREVEPSQHAEVEHSREPIAATSSHDGEIMDQSAKLSQAKPRLSRHPMLEQELTDHTDHNAYQQ